MKTFEVWAEGYHVTGNSNTHQLVGTAEAFG